ncbi:DNA primase [Prevotella sp. E9-3]|uniref:DNA primase n=1 Tax=Prevotella sp. E9-3 TaxID=2913621 RepID=UPI001EDC2B1A|nr:DNA primase [Prevotella sp. E9-3]UKK48745.1 DNA primase [Prevotella sp. E9-3]
MIKEHIIEKLISLNIQDVVGDYVQLKKAGVNWKGLCPFHDDKTPSFYVSPSKNICHCFVCGQGGNPISFVMKKENCDFRQACKILGDKYHIQVEEEPQREQTKEERELQAKRESAFVIYDHVQRHFVECIHADTPEAKATYDYAVNRWGAETVEEMGIGYAPKDWQDIITFARKEGLSIPIMKELRLISTSEKGNDYGFYNDRLMIPIKDKFGRVISYTARTMDEHKEKGTKYMNGAESFFFTKGNHLFGLDTAQREGARQELFYVVEGAPDVIKLQEIGITNTIAALGTAFTKEQFQLLKRYHCQLCFIPDQDGPGIEAVKKNGRLAMEAGFRVTVKEIPPIEDEDGTKHKQDADSYFHRPDKEHKNSAEAQMASLTTEDFVMWLARHIYNEDQTDTAKSDSVKEICDTLILEQDDFTRESLIEALAKTYGHKTLWRNAVNDAKRRRNEAKAKKSSQRSGIDLRKYGFFEEHNCYWSTEDGSEKQWSNFKMKPLFHIMGVDDSKRLYEITNIDGVTRTLELNADELVNMAKFQIKVESAGNFLWLANIEELKKLKKYLFDITGTAIRIRQYGWQKRGFWAFGNGCIFENGWYPADHMGIVHLHDADPKLDNYYLQGASDLYAEDTSYFAFERQFVMPEGHSSISLHDFALMMADVFGNNAKVAVCYLLASIFRDIITGYTTNFPLLNLFGPKGSGKSELGITLMRFFTIGDRPINLRNTTAPGLSQALAMSANGMVHLDEYKDSLDMRIIEIIKGAYDGVGRSRLDMDRGKQVEKTPVDCGVIVSGQEMPTLDIAMFSRMIYLTHDTTVHDREAKDKFNRLADIRKMGLQHLTKQILSHRALFESSFYDTYNEVTNEVYDLIDGQQVEDRLWRNWVMLLAAYKTLYQQLSLPFDYEELKALCVEGIKRQNSEIISNNELGNLWNAMMYLYQEGMIFSDGDFKVKYVKALKTDRTEREYRTETPILMLRLSHFIGQYMKMAKQQGETVMSKDSIRYYLTTSGSYLGMRASERWKVYQDGKPKTEVRVDKGGQTRTADVCMFDRCMCFDYLALKEKFDLNLESMSAERADEMEQQIGDAEARRFADRREPDMFTDNSGDKPF